MSSIFPQFTSWWKIIPASDNEKYDEAMLNMFYQRKENHLKGISKSYSVEEAMDIVKQHKK